MQSMMSKSIVDSLNNPPHCKRTCVPYIGVLVKAFCHPKQKGRQHARAERMSAELTIWRVSDEQLNQMKEGTVLQMKNLGVKSGRDGRIQLTAKADTPMEPLSREPTHSIWTFSVRVRGSPSHITCSHNSHVQETRTHPVGSRSWCNCGENWTAGRKHLSCLRNRWICVCHETCLKSQLAKQWPLPSRQCWKTTRCCRIS